MLTFEKIIEPVIPLIKEEQNRLKNDEKLYKLSLYYFMVSLIYAVINKTQSIRLLITEIKTNPDLKKLHRHRCIRKHSHGISQRYFSVFLLN